MDEQSVPKYVQLKRELQSWIFSGRLKPHAQLPSEHELARQFGMSRQTVRQAVGEMVRDGLLYRIRGKGTFCAAPSSRKPGEIPTVGILTTYISEYIFPSIVRGAERVLRDKGYRLLLFSTENDKARERECLELLIEQPLSGLIVEPTKSATGNPNLSGYLVLESQGIPCIMINARYPELECPCVQLDDEAGGFAATEHLIRLGHRRIAGFFKTDDLQGVNRLKGFLRAHRKHRLAFEPDHIVRYDTEGKFAVPLKEAARLLQSGERPTAFVCYNDELAVRMLDVVREAGLSVPEDLSVVGYDDSFLATATEVKLTTLVHPQARMGEQAAELLVGMIEGTGGGGSAESVIHVPELIVRNSTSPPKTSPPKDF